MLLMMLAVSLVLSFFTLFRDSVFVFLMVAMMLLGLVFDRRVPIVLVLTIWTITFFAAFYTNIKFRFYM